MVKFSQKICNNGQSYPSYSMRNERSQQDTDQFMEYYEKYSDDIFRFCMVKTRNRDLSLDITQDTFVKFWEYIVKGKNIDKERALLYRIAKNLVIDNYRKKKPVLLDEFPDFSHYDDETAKRMEDRLDGEKAIELLHRLPERTREIVSLRFLHDFSISEIADTVGRDNKTVSVYLHRGIKQLRDILEEYE